MPEAGSDAGLRDLFYSESAADMALFASPGRPGKRIRKVDRERLVQARQDLRQGKEIPDVRDVEMLAELMSEMIRLRKRKHKVPKLPGLEEDVNLRDKIRNLLFRKSPVIRTGRIVLTDNEKLRELSGVFLGREMIALFEQVPVFRSFAVEECLACTDGLDLERFGRFRILRTEADDMNGRLIFLSRAERFAVIADGEDTFRMLTDRLASNGFSLSADDETTENLDFLCLSLTTKGEGRISTSRDYLRTVSRELDILIRHCWGKNVACLLERLNRKCESLLKEGRPFLVREDYREIDRMFYGKAYCFLLRLHPQKSKNWIKKKYYSRDVNPSGKCLTDPESGSRLMRFQKLCSSHMGAVCRESDTYGSMAGS